MFAALLALTSSITTRLATVDNLRNTLDVELKHLENNTYKFIEAGKLLYANETEEKNTFKVPSVGYVDKLLNESSVNITRVANLGGLGDVIDVSKIIVRNCGYNADGSIKDEECYNRESDSNEIILEFPAALSWGTSISFKFTRSDGIIYAATFTLVDNATIGNVMCSYDDNTCGDDQSGRCFCNNKYVNDGRIYDVENNKLHIWLDIMDYALKIINDESGKNYEIRSVKLGEESERVKDVVIVGSKPEVPALDTVNNLLNKYLTTEQAAELYMPKTGVKNVTTEYNKAEATFNNVEVESYIHYYTIKKLTDKSDYYVTIWAYATDIDNRITFHMSNGAVVGSDPLIDKASKVIWLSEEEQDGVMMWKLHVLEDITSGYYSTHEANYYITRVTYPIDVDYGVDYYTKSEADSKFVHVPEQVEFNNDTERNMLKWKVPTLNKVNSMISDYLNNMPASTPMPSQVPSTGSGGCVKLDVEYDISKGNVAKVRYNLANEHVLLSAHLLDSDEKVVDSYLYDGVLAFASDNAYVDDVNRYYDILVSYDSSNEIATMRITKSKSSEDAALRIVVDYCIVIT